MSNLSSTSSSLRWGILSTGSIAHTFARGLRDATRGELVAVASRDQASADKFGDEFEISQRYPNYQALLDDPGVDAVYIATPHPLHAQWAIKAADAGKHVLLEKPLTLNWPDAQRVVAACERNGVQLLEAFMYRCHPQSAALAQLIRDGELGEVRQIEATFGFLSNAAPTSRLIDPELGGGGILDVGCYTMSFCRLVAGAAQQQPFADPLEIKALGHINESGSDDYTAAVALFPGEITAILSCAVNANEGSFARVVGSKANLRVPSPFFCGDSPNLILEPHGGEKREISVESPLNLYAYEADALAALIAGETLDAPAQTAADALGNMRALDLWRAQIGLKYPAETPARLTMPIGGEPLRVYPNAMIYGTIANVSDAAGAPKPISRIVLGTMLEGAIDPLTHGLALFDDFYERGGTAFDTAWVYGGGNCERVMGHWLRTRGVRDEVTLLVKGAHTPHCTPDGLTRELHQSLERLGVESADIYLLHRDNLDVPVGEFVDVLNEHARAGRIRAFGGSNWSLERLKAANQYAREKGLQPMQVASNNFSLARMIEGPWPGCASSSDAESRAWFEQNGLSLFAWSSQARGFFARADREFTADEELVRCWYSEDNFERLARARELAAQKGVSPVVIAAAYVLAQPFPIYALIGPRSLAETGDSMGALELQLPPDEVKWLNLEV